MRFVILKNQMTYLSVRRVRLDIVVGAVMQIRAHINGMEALWKSVELVTFPDTEGLKCVIHISSTKKEILDEIYLRNCS